LKGCRRIKYNDSNTKSAYLLESTSIKKIIIINKKKNRRRHTPIKHFSYQGHQAIMMVVRTIIMIYIDGDS